MPAEDRLPAAMLPKYSGGSISVQQQYEKTAAFVLPHGYVTGKMVGNKADKAVFDHTCLHFNNFSDNEKKQWNEGLMTHFGIESEKLPRIVSPFEIIGTTTERFAKEADLISGIPVTAGLGNSAASTFGSGMFETGMLLDCAGTASILCSVVDAYVPGSEKQNSGYDEKSHGRLMAAVILYCRRRAVYPVAERSAYRGTGNEL